MHIPAGNLKAGNLVKKKGTTGPVMTVLVRPVLQDPRPGRCKHIDKYICQWSDGVNIRFGMFKRNQLQQVFIYYPPAFRGSSRRIDEHNKI